MILFEVFLLPNLYPSYLNMNFIQIFIMFMMDSVYIQGYSSSSSKKLTLPLIYIDTGEVYLCTIKIILIKFIRICVCLFMVNVQ